MMTSTKKEMEKTTLVATPTGKGVRGASGNERTNCRSEHSHFDNDND